MRAASPAAAGSLAQLRDSVRCSGVLWTASLVADRLLPVRVLQLWRDRIVDADGLASQVGDVLRAWGMCEEHVAVTLGHMMYADLHGIDSHGCAMLLHYHRQRAAGLLDVRPAITTVQEGDTTALLDGGGGLGHVPADRAMRLAVAKARAAATRDPAPAPRRRAYRSRSCRSRHSDA